MLFTIHMHIPISKPTISYVKLTLWYLYSSNILLVDKRVQGDTHSKELRSIPVALAFESIKIFGVNID